MNSTEEAKQNVTQQPKPEPEPTREVFKAVFVGKPGTGKSTILKKVAVAALKNHRRVLIVTPHENEWLDFYPVHPSHHERIATYKGGRRIVVRDDKELVKTICENFKHGLLIFDDCRVYVPDAPDPNIRAMLLSCRQNDVDFAAVGHGFTTIPPLFFTYATHFCIFATTDNVGRRKNVVLNFNSLAMTVARVNRKALTQPHYYEIIENK